jgi:predicted RNase H-like HicB family nuclease
VDWFLLALGENMNTMPKLELSAVLTKGEVAFVATCPELGVTSQGVTEKEALTNLKEAVELYLEDEDVQKMLKEGTIKKAKVCPLAITA